MLDMFSNRQRQQNVSQWRLAGVDTCLVRCHVSEGLDLRRGRGSSNGSVRVVVQSSVTSSSCVVSHVVCRAGTLAFSTSHHCVFWRWSGTGRSVPTTFSVWWRTSSREVTVTHARDDHSEKKAWWSLVHTTQKKNK